MTRHNFYLERMNNMDNNLSFKESLLNLLAENQKRENELTASLYDVMRLQPFAAKYDAQTLEMINKLSADAVNKLVNISHFDVDQKSASTKIDKLATEFLNAWLAAMYKNGMSDSDKAEAEVTLSIMTTAFHTYYKNVALMTATNMMIGEYIDRMEEG